MLKNQRKFLWSTKKDEEKNSFDLRKAIHVEHLGGIKFTCRRNCRISPHEVYEILKNKGGINEKDRM